MQGLKRHQLAWLDAAGWSALQQAQPEAAACLARPEAQACIAHWADSDLPLVVTRQPQPALGMVALGLPTAPEFGRLRLALQVPATAVQRLGEFPLLADVQGLLPAAALELQHALAACAVKVQVFGSYGWQALTGLRYLRPGSDLDLSIAVGGLEQADAVAHLLAAQGDALPRIDGELAFGNGAAVAWREWREWRSGKTRAVLVRRIHSVALEHGTQWCEESA